jgi:DNA modification methylase
MGITPYYEEDGITIYHGDCREILPQLPKVDLVLTDPPYGTQDLGGGYGRRQIHSTDGRLGRLIANDQDLTAIMSAAALLWSACSQTAYVASFCAPRRLIETAQIFQLAGFAYYGHIVWDKGQPGLGYTIRYSHEDMLVFCKGAPDTPPDAAFSLIRAGVSRVDATTRHPHEKPIEAWLNVCRLIDGTILDPFMGSGTTLVAAKQLGRRAIGIELEEKYCEIAVERLRQSVLALTPPTPEVEQAPMFPGS